MFNFRITFFFLLFIGPDAFCQNASIDPSALNIIFTSDVHYGIARKDFRGHKNVAASDVNAALVGQMNQLPRYELPNDGGINAGKKINVIDCVIEAGDITNRMEPPVQTSALSWLQFEHDFINGLRLKGHDGQPSQLFFVPGNHDVSNAIGYPGPMLPLTDPSAMVNLYNREMKPKEPVTSSNYDYNIHKINFSRYIDGVHFIFITIWPDSLERIWMDKDLDTVDRNTPVIIVAHDPPRGDARHFTNPEPPHDINAAAKFQNLVPEYYKEGDIPHPGDVGEASTDKEQKGFVAFLKRHPCIKAYLHGHENWTEFYRYHGPDNDVDLPVFRVDSPMKGKYSSKDETLLSFELLTVNRKNLTVRECLWNTKPLEAGQEIRFGKSITIPL